MKIFTPGLRSLLSPGVKATITASVGTTIFFSPALYFRVSVWPSTPVTACSTLALVMLLFGIKSHGRSPSPVPRIASGKICTSIALRNIGTETNNVPFWQALHKINNERDRLTPGRASTANEHNVEGSPGCDLIPELYHEGDYVIDNKKRLDCFIGTDLDLLLKSLHVRTICFMGINTNTCVL